MAKGIVIDPEDRDHYELCIAAILQNVLAEDDKFLSLMQVFDSRKETRNFIGSVLSFGTPHGGPRVWYVVNPEWEYIRCDSLAGVYRVFSKTHDVIVIDKYAPLLKDWPRVEHNGVVVINQLISQEQAKAA
jgi:hypothetical protein